MAVARRMFTALLRPQVPRSYASTVIPRTTLIPPLSSAAILIPRPSAAIPRPFPHHFLSLSRFSTSAPPSQDEEHSDQLPPLHTSQQDGRASVNGETCYGL
ncbi:hypothetical protein CCACVL1_26295 [Corchorus capsularis]|uniref:Uncharacterized protein n=1 Tax=Corchorus capsularis TaxID=210143 RepID=A0A1R3GFH8_COCAP|nr:hypothetical protein CCACVL1_26295 [Corchorus capsularis]